MLLLAKTAFMRVKRSIIPTAFNTKSVGSKNSAYISRTQGTGSSRRKMTFSFWFNRSANLNSNCTISIAAGADFIELTSGGVLNIWFDSGTNGKAHSTTTFSNSTWYHVVVQIDTSNVTGSERVKIYINGSDTTTIDIPITQNYDTNWGNNGTDETLVANDASQTVLFDELSKIDNQVLGPSSFATANVPIDISALTFGSQGWWIRCETGLASTLGHDSSPNALTFTNSGYVDGDFSSNVPS